MHACNMFQVAQLTFFFCFLFGSPAACSPATIIVVWSFRMRLQTCFWVFKPQHSRDFEYSKCFEAWSECISAVKWWLLCMSAETLKWWLVCMSAETLKSCFHLIRVRVYGLLSREVCCNICTCIYVYVCVCVCNIYIYIYIYIYISYLRWCLVRTCFMFMAMHMCVYIRTYTLCYVCIQ